MNAFLVYWETNIIVIFDQKKILLLLLLPILVYILCKHICIESFDGEQSLAKYLHFISKKLYRFIVSDIHKSSAGSIFPPDNTRQLLAYILLLFLATIYIIYLCFRLRPILAVRAVMVSYDMIDHDGC